MKRFLFAALLLAPAGCRREETADTELAPAKAVASGQKLITFEEKTGAFSCFAPADWKMLEADGSAGSFIQVFGPMEGPDRGKTSISVNRYPNVVDKIRTPQELWSGFKLTDKKMSALEKTTIAGREFPAFHYEAPQHPPNGWKVLYMNRVDTVMIPFEGGFFEITHSAPADSYKDTLPVFEAMVAGFQPKR
ncbi:MAG: hypothetical protein A2V88_02395 [Elusimicrobia bacterium RBG_16_66_12]|nr:MAG: hypothetical protein A2V88_02395 [Elusimicrobia bacterium RBG_16_66_12]